MTTPTVTIAINKLPHYFPDPDDVGDLAFYGGHDEYGTLWLLENCTFYKVGETIYICQRMSGALVQEVPENKFFCLFAEE